MTRRQPRRALLTATLGYFAALASCIMLAACSIGHASELPVRANSFARAFELALTSTPEFEAERPKPKLETTVSRAYDPYEGWHTWCEDRPTPCPKSGKCTPDAAGRARKCVRPWWSKIEKVCAIPYSERPKREAIREDVQRIVTAQCTGRCNAEELGKLIRLVAMRETTMRPWKRHLLDGDVREGEKNWLKKYKTMAPRNRHYADMLRWGGNGLLGQQAVTFAVQWDPQAPPEILCRPTVAVATYLNCTRVTHRKQSSLGITPTWETLHASCSGGKVRPKGPSEDFRKRARRIGLDPEQPVRMEWLGVSLGKTPLERNLTLQLIEAAVAFRSEQS